MSHERHGAKQPNRFDPARAAILDDPARFAYVPPDELLALLELPAGGTLVDFGTGTGLYALEIARRRPDVRVLALDEQPQMLAHVRDAIARSGLGNVEAVASDAVDMLAGSANRILALNVLHELGDRALDEVRSLLAGGGTAVFVDWNAEVERPVGPPRDHPVRRRRRRIRSRSAVRFAHTISRARTRAPESAEQAKSTSNRSSWASPSTVTTASETHRSPPARRTSSRYRPAAARARCLI